MTVGGQGNVFEVVAEVWRDAVGDVGGNMLQTTL